MKIIDNFKKRRAQKLHVAAQELEEKGDTDGAISKYLEAIQVEPDKSESYYNIGLIYKYRSDWRSSFEFNQKAYLLDPNDEATRWNFAIAATALRDWKSARQAWADNGIELDSGDGQITLDFGPTPVRLNSDSNAEVVWARRLDPVRAKIESIPLPDSGYRCGDIVLHDGAAVGYRMLGQRECPVFNVLELFEPSKLSTFKLEIEVQDSSIIDDLTKVFNSAGIDVEDWTANVQMLCKECSEGVPHTHHEEKSKEWKSERTLGIAAESLQDIKDVLLSWQQSDARIINMTCELSAADRHV